MHNQIPEHIANGVVQDRLHEDQCMALFPWAHFRRTKSAVKMHTLLNLCGNIPEFILISV
jgi:hypothetical protein